MPLIQIHSPILAILRAAERKPEISKLIISRLKDLEKSERHFGASFHIGGHSSKQGLQSHYKAMTDEIHRRQDEIAKLKIKLAEVHSKELELEQWKQNISHYSGGLSQIEAEIMAQYKKIIKEKYSESDSQ